MPGVHAYLDYNATAPLRAGARAAMVEVLDVVGNPSSVHGPGRAARKILETARTQVSALACADPADLVFTSGATEANALALRGASRRLIASAVEHPSVLENAAGATIVQVDENGVVDLANLEFVLDGDDRPALISVMAANNETGAIQPVAAVADLARRHGTWLHVDAVQLAGKGDLQDVWACADLLSLSAHKIGGPSGVGALLTKPGVELKSLVAGGGQERGRRSGTENLIGIAGFGAAAEAATRDLADMDRIADLRDRLESGVRSLDQAAQIYGAAARRLPNTSCIGLPGMPAETQVMNLDLAGVAVSAGAACSSGKVRASHVLSAMGLDQHAASSAIRVSLGWDSTEKDVDIFLNAWAAMSARRHAA